MSDEFLAIVAMGIAVMAFNWRMTSRLESRLDRLEAQVLNLVERLSRLEGAFQMWTGRRNDQPAE